MTPHTSHSHGASLAFIGHVSIDQVENLHGTRTQPGGGALYAALAAKTLNVPSALVSAIGKDFAYRDCFQGLDTSGVKTLNIPTTRFHIRYNDHWDANYLKASASAGARIAAQQGVSVSHRGIVAGHDGVQRPGWRWFRPGYELPVPGSEVQGQRA
jgi:hypothetical protein